ncbi:GumC family protein [Flagellimonas sp. 2504JD4-2]
MKFNLLFFVRILLRHIWLLITVPIVLGGLVFVLTQNQPKVYDSKARIYTAFASGSTIELDNTKFDYSKTNIAYDNLLNLIKSRTTLETVALKLFAQHMLLDSADIRIISKKKYGELMEIVPEDVKALVIKGDLQKTYESFLQYKEEGHDNFINELLNLEHPDYSIAKILEKIGVRRISISDFVDITYQSEDPGICQNTLLILSETFIKANADIKANQSDAVVNYFENQLNKTTSQLNAAEKELLNFNKGNKIMNYYEQTKQLASRRENFELRYQEVQQRYHAAKAVLPELEKKLGAHEKKRLQSNRILDLRNELAELNYAISMKSLDLSRDSTVQASNAEKIAESTKRLNKVKTELKKAVDTVFVVDHDKHGVASSDILTDWLSNTINFEGAKAELQILDQKRIEFDELYTWYAPLGATMKKLERKINIEEQEYLSLLHSLGLAKLRQQNVELQSNLKITEVPFFPIKPNPSKRMMLVIVAAVVGFILVAITVLVLEFLDGNLNTAKRAEEKMELKVSSIFPVISSKNKKIDYKYLQNKAVNAISRDIILNQFKKKSDGPVANMLFSTQESEGKTFVCKHLIDKLCELGYKTLHITYDDFDLAIQDESYQKITYEVSDQLYKISNIEEFDQNSVVADFNLFDFIILELPGIIKNPFPVKLAATMDHSFLVVRANRAWGEADQNALALFNEATTGPEPTIILNGVKILEMETVVGDLPKKRSLIRKFIKRLVQLRFFAKKTVA